MGLVGALPAFGCELPPAHCVVDLTLALTACAGVPLDDLHVVLVGGIQLRVEVAGQASDGYTAAASAQAFEDPALARARTRAVGAAD